MRIIGRDDNRSVSKMGLPDEIVKKLNERGINCWDELTIITLEELPGPGLTPSEINTLSEAVGRNTKEL